MPGALPVLVDLIAAEILSAEMGPSRESASSMESFGMSNSSIYLQMASPSLDSTEVGKLYKSV